MINPFVRILPFLVPVILLSCGEGIAPDQVEEVITKAGFSGTITFKGDWPPDVTRTHLVVFQNPLNSIADFNVFNLKFVSLEIPFGAQVYSYSSLDSVLVPISAGEYAYVAVAQQKTPALSLDRKDWYVVGVYFAAGDTIEPGTLYIPERTLVKGIDIICDFNNPPPQPPGG